MTQYKLKKYLMLKNCVRVADTYVQNTMKYIDLCISLPLVLFVKLFWFCHSFLNKIVLACTIPLCTVLVLSIALSRDVQLLARGVARTVKPLSYSLVGKIIEKCQNSLWATHSNSQRVSMCSKFSYIEQTNKCLLTVSAVFK